MNDTKPHWKRRQYLINPQFQLRFMLHIVAAALLGIGALYLSNIWYFDTLELQGKELGLDQEHVYFQFISEQLTLLNRTFLATSALVFVCLMLAGLFLSHRIAGAVYRMEKHLEELTAGDTDLQPMRFRENDFFPEIAVVVNGFITHFQARQQTPDAAD